MNDRHWTSARFRAFAVVACGPSLDAVGAVAESFSIPLADARGWAGGVCPIPPEYRARFEEFYRLRTAPVPEFRRDDWLYARGPKEASGKWRNYVVHLATPALVCRIADGTGEPETRRPPDKWLFAHGEDDRREYLVHMGSPQFVCRIVGCDPDGAAVDDDEIDDSRGIAWLAGPGYLLCEFQWIERPPPPELALELLRLASDALLDELARAD